MDQIDLYDRLAGSLQDTIIVDGHVLMYKNGSKWHLCLNKRNGGFGNACGQGGPENPHRTLGHNEDFYKDIFIKSTEVMEPREALEQDRICTNCRRVMEREFDFDRVIVAVSGDISDDIGHFAEKVEE